VVQRESFIFCHYLWISWHRGLDVLFVLLRARCS